MLTTEAYFQSFHHLSILFFSKTMKRFHSQKGSTNSTSPGKAKPPRIAHIGGFYLLSRPFQGAGAPHGPVLGKVENSI